MDNLRCGIRTCAGRSSPRPCFTCADRSRLWPGEWTGVWPLALGAVDTVLVACGRERKVAFAIMLLESAFMAMPLIGFLAGLVMSSKSGGASSTPVGLIVWGGLMMAVLRPMQTRQKKR